jgi:hypothetical protein
MELIIISTNEISPDEVKSQNTINYTYHLCMSFGIHCCQLWIEYAYITF